MLEPFRRGIAWYKYSSLERDFINLTSYIPFEEQYDEIWSENFGELLVRIGGSVDSFFRSMLKSRTFDNCPEIVALRNKRHLDIIDFHDAFEPIFRLSSAEVEIAYGLTYYAKRCPFEEFARGEVPHWWNSYNHVKHEWFDCLKEATLKNTVEALAGLFVLNVLHKENQQYLILQNVIISGTGIGGLQIMQLLKKSMVGIPSNASLLDIKSMTPLFMHTFRPDPSVPE